MRTHRVIRRLPEPWLVDDEHLLKELARVRGLVLGIPHRNENFGPINTVLDAVWRLEEQIRFLAGLRRDAQQAWQKRATKTQRAIARKTQALSNAKQGAPSPAQPAWPSC